MRQLQGVISTRGELQVSLVLLPAPLGHVLNQGDAGKSFGDLLAIWIRGEQALLRFQVMVPIDQALGRSSKTENSQIYTVNCIVAWRTWVKTHAGVMSRWD